MNKAMLIGRLTRDTEMSYAANNNNTAVARYTLAINRPYRSNGDQEADFIRCVAFGKTAEIAEKYLFKGVKVAIEGRIQTGSYMNRDGQMVYTTDIIVERQEFLEKKIDNSHPSTNPDSGESYGDRFLNVSDGIEEELPFN